MCDFDQGKFCKSSIFTTHVYPFVCAQSLCMISFSQHIFSSEWYKILSMFILIAPAS